MGLSMGGSFGLYSAQARHNQQKNKLGLDIKKVKTQQRPMIPFPLPPVKPWGLCMGLSMGGSFGLYLAQARHKLQAHTRQRPMIPFPFPPVKPWGLCMGLSMGGSFGLYLAQARHN